MIRPRLHPDHPKPTASEIMQLGKGQLYVCYGTTLVRTYVQPAGMEDEHAKAVSLGDEKPESWSSIVRSLDSGRAVGEETDGSSADPEEPRGSESGDGRDQARENSEDAMWKEKYEALKLEYDALAERLRKLETPVLTGALKDSSATPRVASTGAKEERAAGADDPDAKAPAAGKTVFDLPGLDRQYDPVLKNGTMDAIYRYVVSRAAKEDPKTLRTLFVRPELLVEIRRDTIEANGGTLRGALAILISEKYFDGVREFGDVRKEFIRRGFVDKKTPNVQIGQALAGLVELGFLTKEETGYQCVAGMKVRIQESAA